MPPLARCLPVLILGCALAAADPAPQPGSSAILVTEINLKRTVRLPEGQVAKATMEQFLGVNLSGTLDPALLYNGECKLVCDSATTDTGEDVLLPQVDPRERLPSRLRHRRTAMGLTMGLDKGRITPGSLRLKYPDKPAKTLSVSGAVLLTCEAKKGETADFVLASGEMKIQGLAISAVKPQKPGECALVLENALDERLKTIEFADADGKVIESNSFNGLREGAAMTKIFRLNRPGAVAVTARITLIGEEVEVRVPFAFKDLPLEASLAKAPQHPQLMPMTPTNQPTPAPPAKNDF